MITYSKAVVDNKCQITFDFTPDDVTYKRSNYTATHKGGDGTTRRQGIWEGIWCIDAQIKIGDGAWKKYSLPANKKITVTVASNDVNVQAWGKYELRTMGYYFKDTTGTYPFFWYGNIDKVAYKYPKGSFKDANSNKPDGSFYSINACVPADWTYVKATWSDWAYNHAKANSKTQWTFDDGRYAQRNGNTLSASYSNGWISDSGYAQIYRKSSMFYFTKEFYSDTVKTSGIAVNPGLPVVEVPAAKGDTGNVVLYYKANNSGNGYIAVQAKCGDKIVDIMTYSNSPEFGHDWKKTLNPDFNSIFGESYRANDVYYRAKAKNKAGYESAWTGWIGTNRYNGRPSIPTGLKIQGKDGLIYKSVTFSWNKSTDPDGDSVVYDVWLRAINSNGTWVKDGIIKSANTALNYDIDISHYDDDTRFVAWVRASDNLIVSDWSSEIHFTKGSKPKKAPVLLCPVYANSIIYANRQRFGFTYDGNSTCVVNFNGFEYNSDTNPDMFALGSDKFIFKPRANILDGKVSISAYLKNSYGVGASSQKYEFTKRTLENKFHADNIITANLVASFQNIIKGLAKSYNLNSDFALATKDDYYEASQYNNCYNKVFEINDYINSLVNDTKLDYSLTTKAAVQNEINSAKLWEELIQDITNM